MRGEAPLREHAVEKNAELVERDGSGEVRIEIAEDLFELCLSQRYDCPEIH